MPLAGVVLPIGQGGTGALVQSGTFSVAGTTSTITCPAIGNRSCRLEIRGATTGTAASHVSVGLDAVTRVQGDKNTVLSTVTAKINDVSSRIPIASTAIANTEIDAVINYKSFNEGTSTQHRVESKSCDDTFTINCAGYGVLSGSSGGISIIVPAGVTFTGSYKLFI